MVFDGGSNGSSPASGSSSVASLAVQVVRGRLYMFFASFLIMAAAGATYIFGIYSKGIKTSLGYDQQTLNTLSFFKDLGANVGIPSGLINEVTPPWVVLSMGAGLNLFGYLMIYLAITGRIARPAVWQMCLYICVGANSQTFANTGSLVTCVKNFPESRGIVLGLLKGFVGLSGAIFTQLYYAIYGGHDGHDNKALVLLIAWLPAAVSAVFVHTIRIMPAISSRLSADLARKGGPFYCFLKISLALAAYLLVMIILEKQLTFSHAEYGASASVVLFLLLFPPLAVVVKEEIRIRAYLLANEKSTSANAIDIAVETPATPPPPPPPPPAPPAEPEPAPASSVIGKTLAFLRPPKRGDDYNILQALFSVDMMVLFFATICGVGGTLTAIDNMGQIGESLGYPAKSISTFVSLISIWNYMGRVAAGFASEIVLAKYKFPRPLVLTLILLLSCVGHLLIAFGVTGSLYFASVVIGFCFGAQWPLLFAIISEVFGLKYYSTLYNFGGVASPIGSYILNVRVTGHLYDREADKQNHRGANGDLTCLGVQCFRLSFLIITAATLLGAAVSLILVWRTRNFYKGDIYARFRQGEEEEAAAGESGLPMKKIEGEERREDGGT